MQKATWPVKKLALAVISGMIVGRGAWEKSHTQTMQWKPQTLTSLIIIDLKRAIIPGFGN